MEIVENKTAVQQALETLRERYPTIQDAVLSDIFRTAVEAKADDDQVLVSRLEIAPIRKHVFSAV